MYKLDPFHLELSTLYLHIRTLAAEQDVHSFHGLWVSLLPAGLEEERGMSWLSSGHSAFLPCWGLAHPQGWPLRFPLFGVPAPLEKCPRT